MNDVSLVGEATDGPEAVRLAAELAPDVVVLDISMPGVNGIEATGQIVSQDDHVAVLILTMYEDDDLVFSAMRAGARGYILKGAAPEDVGRAIRSVAAGEILLGAPIARRAADYFSGRLRQQTAFPELSDRERETLSRLDQLEADEERMTSLIEELDARRREMERRNRLSGAAEPSSASIAPEDAGTLDWPVEGQLIYRFGRERRPDGTVLRWNGVGIAARPGTPVRAVREGTVVMAGPFEGYGPTVVVSHGDGFYTLYLYLEEIGVVQGRRIERRQVVGTVGGSDTPEGPHIEFQVRGPVNGGTPQAMDPLAWLRERG